MEGIVHIRVDDRLIHGQVATRWATGLKVNRIMVIDDKVAANELEKSVLRMAAPSGVNTSILDVEKAVNNIKNGNYQGQRVLVVIKTPEVAVQLLKAGLNVKQVNIGNLSNRPNTLQIKKSVSLSESERKAVDFLIEKGVEVTAQMVPDDPAANIISYL
ncbi:PTS mannose/fructose/sorbose transporter subunit IIB [Niallia circulans]|jgi:mannose PTS system EIIAB component|uniref:PTS system mannose/fructose/N-acetylgalactosamine-transporter subunit IIB n=1 Tax=Niallia TaxID=2837506 RepID=UPI000F446C42|nr:PTS sugar transporter subunit IIB [Niallia circulans]AYV66163.1 PTS mannose/fructose/sorbose transporter subunit IIB [Niallia circulans]QJX62046.1 PTS sugar transporter subunit IIB [Niallia circulans]